ncbi:uncharacterized protein LOC135596703 isoform X1 [Musa acuminata AAA Group]|uniref:uncharacterized protein LOC135596703 isoform X1 n=1 Tax=Musa acuminata AAA Group TaxID=214697 RepID=UPI0031D6977B
MLRLLTATSRLRLLTATDACRYRLPTLSATSLHTATYDLCPNLISGVACGNLETSNFKFQQWGGYTVYRCPAVARLSSVANKESSHPTEAVEELYQKMLKSVEAQTMPPNAWLWSLISNCLNREDIKLLFQILQKLRIFRLSNLRIHSNFNSHLCMRVSEACTRADALDYGLKALWKHNIYGLTPSIGSAHYLLSYAKEHNDDKLMVKIMRVLEKNSMPLQPRTADIVFSICHNTNKWDLISKYSARFLKAGVKLHQTAFDIWMEFAAKIGDVQSIWKIGKLREKFVKRPTLSNGFSCAKGHLLEHNPETAAATIHFLYKNLPDLKKPQVIDELQKLISQWPQEVIRKQKKEDKQALIEALKRDIPDMVSSLLNMGLDVTMDLKELSKQEA